MNIKMIFYILGNILKVLAGLLLLPLIVALIDIKACPNDWWAFLIPAAGSLILGFLLSFKKPKRDDFYAREGFTMVGLSWILLSLIGCLPFVISGQIPSFIDAFFETVSGFTTTGASILSDVEALSRPMLFWRSFTHWIGGMGVLVFILAILPTSEGQNIFIMRAESTGPQVGKLVSKVKGTARILYIIYFCMTVIETIMLWCGDMNFYEALVHSFGTAGTGGFGILNTSLGSYSSYSQIVIGVFMILFGINFNIFYLILTGKIIQVLKSEELRWYLGVILFSVIAISVNIYLVPLVDGTVYYVSYGHALKDSFFQVASIITTTGYSTTDFDLWPALSKSILFILMFIGGCAGSTGGGIKVSRFVILNKSLKREIKKLIHPRAVSNIQFEGSTLSDDVSKSVTNYFALIMVIFVVGVLIVSFDGFDFETNITAVAATLNNIGPGFGKVGPTCNFGSYSGVSKITFVLLMLVGRLEIYPIVMLFNPKTWTNR